MREEVLRMERVTYHEQGALQLEDFTLSLFAGEIMGLLPMDSHGLTALINLLEHNLPLQTGYIYYREELLNSWRVARPRHNRIGVIQSKSSLVDGLTVADNIFVLRPGFRAWYLRPALLYRQLQPLLDEIGVDIPAYAYVEGLTPFQRCVVELVKAVAVSNCHLVILRDVCTFISESELARLHTILRHYAEQGTAFLYIGFHFEELSQICDRTALLNNGRISKVLHRGEPLFHGSDLYERQVRSQLAQQEVGEELQPPALLVSHLYGGAVEDLSFSVAAGECLVLQDLSGRIFDDLLDIFLGNTLIEGGYIQLGAQTFSPGLTRDLAILPERPSSSMLFPEMSYFDNLCFTIDHRLPELWYNQRVKMGMRKALGEQFGSELFDRSPEDLTKSQKYDLVYHRLLLQCPRAVICLQPFRGADLALRMHIWELLEDLMKKGIAVVILAVNLADSLSLADYLIRLHPGAPPEVYERHDFADIPFIAPWRDLYRRGEEQKQE